MVKKIFSSRLAILFLTLLFSQILHAGVKPTYSDSCCAPDSLRVSSINGFAFCVTWDIPDDSVCLSPSGFEIEWRKLGTLLWSSAYMPYVSGSTITYCDSVTSCGTYTWRVRTKCNDSTFSDWVYGPKFTITCEHDRPVQTENLTISPNPAYSSITIAQKGLNGSNAQVTISGLDGRIVHSKMVSIYQGMLYEKILVSGFKTGTYYISIVVNGAVISRKSLFKE